MAVQEVAVMMVEEEDDFDQRYEILPTARTARKTSESDHGYEKIQLKSEDSFNDPRYERIHLKREGAAVEPNYEIVGYKWYFIWLIVFCSIQLHQGLLEQLVFYLNTETFWPRKP